MSNLKTVVTKVVIVTKENTADKIFIHTNLPSPNALEDTVTFEVNARLGTGADWCIAVLGVMPKVITDD
jgi:hypothetical protein